MTARFTNRLLHETSPYLRQHAHNPVDWYPWGDEAIARARQLDRPIFLSIGYSACHWCHVMEHESFESEEIAKILNDNFISIKVDREERPDLDQIYMAAVQMVSGSGGWPMSVWLTTEMKPFTGGTYFPPDDRYGRPGFRRILMHLVDAWTTRRADVEAAANDITQHLQHLGQLQSAEGELSDALLRNAARYLERAFDARHGGFGRAPKFPHPMDLRLLLRIWKRFNDGQSLHMARHTLERMAMGGIYDHLGGGFARYSTDEKWLAPHFEKMLYDNALLVPGYVEAFQITGDRLYRDVVDETVGWVLREMTSPEGPFYSTLDADSEGEEGKFYVWRHEEVTQILGPTSAELFCDCYNVQPRGNWEDPHDPGAPKNILHRTKTFAQLAALHRIPEEQLREVLAYGCRRLIEARASRIRPGLDDKVLTSWNGLMIGALAQAGSVLERREWVAAATRAADFILATMRGDNGRLLRTWSRGSAAKLNGYLEDYAFFLDGLVSLYEATFEVKWITAALQLADVMVEQFWDAEQGGFFYTGKDHEALIARGKDPHDNAIPSGNSMAVTVLLRLVKLTGRDDLRQKAETTLRLYRPMMEEHPSAVAQMLVALDFYLGPVREVAILGDAASDETRRVLRAVRKTFTPGQVVALASGPSDCAVALLSGKTSAGGVTTYVCENFACQAPLVGAEAAERALSS